MKKTVQIDALSSRVVISAVQSICIGIQSQFLIGAICFVCLSQASFSHGQSIWNVAGNGGWNTAGNWSTLLVPNSATTDVIIDGNTSINVAVELDTPIGTFVNVRNLSISSGDSLQMLNGRNLAINANLFNDGVISVNSNSLGSNTALVFQNNSMISGSGSITLNRDVGLHSQLSTSGGVTVTQALGHTIQGRGVLSASLINDGLVNANVNGGTLFLSSNDKTNNGIFQSSNGGVLQVNSNINNSGGTLRGDNGRVDLNSTSITGGVLDTLNGGEIRVLASTTSTLNGVTNNGIMNSVGSGNIQLSSGFINNGTVTVNSNAIAAATSLQALDSLAIDGVGTIVLNRNVTTHSAISTGGGATITHGASHTIRGTGSISASMINNGLISADVNLATLHIIDSNKTNNNFFQATSGGLMRIGANINNSNGTIRADNGIVELNSASITGGVLETMNGGEIRTLASTTTVLNSVTNNGTLNMLAGGSLHLSSGLINNGTITVNLPASATTTTVQALESLTIGGAGTVVLTNPSSAGHSTISTAGGATITNGANHTIRGGGTVSASLINNGLVSANINGATLFLNTNAKTNNGVFQATNGGILRVESAGLLTNFSGSTLTAGSYFVDAGSTMRLAGMNVQTLNGHVRLNGVGSNIYNATTGTTSALASLNTIGSAGQFELRGGRTFTTSASGLANQGSLILMGSGTQLTVNGNFLQTAGSTYVLDNSTLIFNGASNTVSGGILGGDGTIIGDVLFGGSALLSAGVSPGTLTFGNNLTWGAGGLVLFDLGFDAASSDLISVNGDLLKSGVGNFDFTFVDNGWVAGQTYDLITFASTDFDLDDFGYTNGGGFMGTFAFSGGNTLQFTVNAIPEPSSLVLILTMVATMVAGRRRRAKV
ncbi:MAG: PEP-CTERM sorting domain-containing protein [Pirellulaceae bacterium]|nr:PEP-CTERM sorting domain-containing protein [Pirellulaceae bacterium]